LLIVHRPDAGGGGGGAEAAGGGFNVGFLQGTTHTLESVSRSPLTHG
jgi:hypothetical protein